MKTRALFAAPIFVAIALHAWASGAYGQDIFVAVLALAAIPLGGRVPLGQTAQRVFAFLFFVAGGVIGWSHLPELGYGPGTLSRSASLIAVGSILSAVSRLYARAGWSGERATFVLGTLAVAASGATRLGAGYAVFASVYVVLALVALRARDPARARRTDLAARHRIVLAVATLLACGITFAFVRVLPPVHDVVQRAIERKFVVHDMVGFGAGSSLGEMRDMIVSDVEVLRVMPPPRSLPVDYLRGAVYDDYRSDGFWSESPFAERLHDVSVGTELASPGSGVRVRRIAGAASRYFLPLDARDVHVASGAIEVDELGSALTVGSERATEYTFVLGAREKLVPTPPRSIDLQIPRNEREALAQLASGWTHDAPLAEDKLDAIRTHLEHDFHYSLTLVRDADDPLLDFLFRQRVGYCTYFATAMTMLARASGIPARLVTGYRVAEWSPIAGEYVVREKNAHAWVEAWQNGGWHTYDPTPLVELPQNQDHLAAFGTLAADSIVRAEQAVTYTVAHVTPAQLVALLAALGGMWAFVRWFRRGGTRATHDRGGEGTDRPLECFATLASSLDKRGFARERDEPLGRYAGRLAAEGLNDAASLVERYAALRYGGLGDRATLERDVAQFVAPAAPVR